MDDDARSAKAPIRARALLLGDRINTANLGRDNVILTPHTAFYSVEALNELQTKCAADVARVLSGEKPVYEVKMG